MAVEIKTLKQKSRVQDHTSSGMDIERVFYVEPYEAFPEVLDALLGSVKDGKITFPAVDPWVKNDGNKFVCYCNQARVEQVDPMAGVTLELDLLKTEGELFQKLETKEKWLEGAPGAYITAHYRPLVVAYDYETPLMWKWIDPIFKTGLRQMPWPDGLFIAEKSAGKIHTDPVEAAVASPYEIQVADFSIKQMFVETIPWDVLGMAAGAVNEGVFPDQKSAAANHLPKFASRTLKYINTDVVNMMDSKGNRWFELTHQFQWVRHVAPLLFDIDGTRGSGDVTWNHIYTHPSTFGLEGPTAWYEVWIGGQQQIGLGGTFFDYTFGNNKAVIGRLFKSFDFMELFK